MSIKSVLNALKVSAHDDYARAERMLARAIKDKDYEMLALKGGMATLGCVLTGNGVYQVLKGVEESIPNQEHPGQEGTNWTRVYVGAMTAFFGAAALYLASQSRRREWL